MRGPSAAPTRANIFAVVTRKFAGQGFGGPDINEAASATVASKRVVSCHSGSKVRLGHTVLEAAEAGVGHRVKNDARYPRR